MYHDVAAKATSYIVGVTLAVTLCFAMVTLCFALTLYGRPLLCARPLMVTLWSLLCARPLMVTLC